MSTAIVNQMHQLAVSTYYPKANTQYDTHKKSELRSIYNNIVKVNKESPIYLLKNPKESQTYAINIKENSRFLHNALTALGGMDEDKVLSKKAAYSSNEHIATATFVGTNQNMDVAPDLELEVVSLAKKQTNLGKFLPDVVTSLAEHEYSFDISIDDLSYEFQFNIKNGQTNKHIQERIANLIQNAGIGLTASLVTTDDKSYAIQIDSVDTGQPFGKDTIFTISDSNTSRKAGTVDYFGLDYVSKHPTNAEFIVNGESRFAVSNNFTIGKMYEVNLKGISPSKGITTTIGLKADVDSLTDNVNQFVNSYNSFMGKINEFANNHPASGKLLREVNALASTYTSSLSSLGLERNEDGSLKVNEGLLRLMAGEDKVAEDFAPLKDFTHALLRKTDQISLDPMSYVDKTVVAYKNPGHNLNSPYVSSAYSGMLFNMYY